MESQDILPTMRKKNFLTKCFNFSICNLIVVKYSLVLPCDISCLLHFVVKPSRVPVLDKEIIY